MPFLHMAVCFLTDPSIVSWIQYPKIQFSLKGFSTGDSFALEGMRDNICRHFWLSQLGEGAMLLASSRPGIVHALQCTGQHPTTKSYLTQNVNSAAVEKPRITVMDTKTVWSSRTGLQESGLIQWQYSDHLEEQVDTQDYIFSDLLWVLSLTTEFLSELSYWYSLGLNYLALPVVGEGIIMSKEKATF